MLRKVIDWVREDEFEMSIGDDYIVIINYLNVSYMEEDKIGLTYKGGSIIIKGSKLRVTKLVDQEMVIRGEFSHLEFRRNS